MKTPRRHVLDRPAQVRAASSPTAQRLLGAVERTGPCSAAELEEHIGLPRASLYYHLNRLARVGVLRRTTRTTETGRSESLWEVPGEELEVISTGSPRFDREVARSGRGILALATRLYSAAVGRMPRPTQRARRRNVLVQVQARLAPQALAEVHRRLDELAAYVAEQDDPSREFACFTGVLSPAPRER